MLASANAHSSASSAILLSVGRYACDALCLDSDEHWLVARLRHLKRGGELDRFHRDRLGRDDRRRGPAAPAVWVRPQLQQLDVGGGGRSGKPSRRRWPGFRARCGHSAVPPRCCAATISAATHERRRAVGAIWRHASAGARALRDAIEPGRGL